MNAITRRHRAGALLARLYVVAFSVAWGSCTTIKLISDYDEGIDKGITEFQKSAETFLTGLEHTDRPKGALTKAEVTFFDQAAVDLSSLQIRARAIPKNDLTVQMIENLTKQISTLRELLPEGVTTAQVGPIREAVNTSTGAILKLELAKKRGDQTPQ